MMNTEPPRSTSDQGDDPATAEELMAATGISAERLAEIPGGLGLLHDMPPELSALADELDENDPS